MSLDIKKQYEEALIQSLTKDMTKWTSKGCYADKSWVDYYSPMYGSTQF